MNFPCSPSPGVFIDLGDGAEEVSREVLTAHLPPPQALSPGLEDA